MVLAKPLVRGEVASGNTWNRSTQEECWRPIDQRSSRRTRRSNNVNFS